jgi:hypothetical protein
MMSTIHKIMGDGLEMLRMRKHPGRKSTNAQGANTTFKPDEYERELPIPTMVNDYNHYKVGMDIHDHYQTYHDIQLAFDESGYLSYLFIYSSLLPLCNHLVMKDQPPILF